MWAQCLGHKNTSRVQPPQRKVSIGPFPRLGLLLTRAARRAPPPVGRRPWVNEGKRRERAEIFRERILRLRQNSLKCERKHEGGDLTSHRRTDEVLAGGEARRMHPKYRSTALGKEAVRDSWAAAPPPLLSPPPLLYYVLLPPLLRLSPRVSVLTPKIPRPCA